jgi:hypothetical protein
MEILLKIEGLRPKKVMNFRRKGKSLMNPEQGKTDMWQSLHKKA